MGFRAQREDPTLLLLIEPPTSLGTIQSAATAAGGLTTLFVAAVPAMYHLGLMTTPRQDMNRLFLLTTITAFYGLFFAVSRSLPGTQLNADVWPE